MGFTGATSLVPKYVISSAVEPSDKTEGRIWYDSLNNKSYISDGINYVELAPDTTLSDVLDLKQSLNLLREENGIDQETYTEVYQDIINTEAGVNGSIDEASSTLNDEYFETNYSNHDFYKKYIDLDSTATQTEYTNGSYQAHDHTWSNINDLVTLVKWASYASGSKSYTVTFTYHDDATEVYTATGDVNNNVGYLFNPIPDKEVKSVRVQAGGSADVRTGTNVYISDVGTETVQTNAQTITENPDGYLIFADIETYNDATITYDISFDGGSTWLTDKEFNVRYSDAHDGNSMIIKFNHNINTAGDLALLNAYAVRLYY